MGDDAHGAGFVVLAVGWHGLTLWRQLRTALPSRFGPSVRYYVTAAALLPVGATIGTILTGGLAGAWHDRLVVAHVSLNVWLSTRARRLLRDRNLLGVTEDRLSWFTPCSSWSGAMSPVGARSWAIDRWG